MSLEFFIGERYIVLSVEGPSFVGTFVGVVGDELKFKNVTEFVELADEVSHHVGQASVLDAEPYRQRIVPTDGRQIDVARSLAVQIETKSPVIVARVPSRDIG